MSYAHCVYFFIVLKLDWILDLACFDRLTRDTMCPQQAWVTNSSLRFSQAIPNGELLASAFSCRLVSIRFHQEHRLDTRSRRDIYLPTSMATWLGFPLIPLIFCRLCPHNKRQLSFSPSNILQGHLPLVFSAKQKTNRRNKQHSSEDEHSRFSKKDIISKLVWELRVRKCRQYVFNVTIHFSEKMEQNQCCAWQMDGPCASCASAEKIWWKEILSLCLFCFSLIGAKISLLPGVTLSTLILHNAWEVPVR